MMMDLSRQSKKASGKSTDCNVDIAPGMLMAATALLDEIPNPSEQEIRENLEGNLCRCTGYEMIVRSVQWAAQNPDGIPVQIGESS